MSPVSLVFHTIVTWEWSQRRNWNKTSCLLPRCPCFNKLASLLTCLLSSFIKKPYFSRLKKSCFLRSALILNFQIWCSLKKIWWYLNGYYSMILIWCYYLVSFLNTKLKNFTNHLIYSRLTKERKHFSKCNVLKRVVTCVSFLYACMYACIAFLLYLDDVMYAV